MIDKKLRDICTYHGDEGTSGYCLSEEQFSQIKSLFKEYAMEIIGENEKVKIKLLPFQKLPKEDEKKLIRNQLRAEQREKLLTEDKK